MFIRNFSHVGPKVTLLVYLDNFLRIILITIEGSLITIKGSLQLIVLLLVLCSASFFWLFQFAIFVQHTSEFLLFLIDFDF